mgnify:FL=1
MSEYVPDYMSSEHYLSWKIKLARQVVEAVVAFLGAAKVALDTALAEAEKSNDP